ncbi:MAG: hypothetical protein U0270_46005 [Labilithrix sp.]
MTKNLGILALAFAALCTTACNKDKPEVSTTTTTSSEIEPSAQPQAAPKDDYLATVRREQLVLRSRIDDELRALDRQLLTTTLDAKSREALLEKRETLRADASVIDHADERGWDELKAVVEHDLEGQPQM